MAEYISSLTGQQMDASLLDMAQHNSEAWAVGKRNGVDVTSADPAYHNNAKWYAGHISEAGHPPYIGENGNWYAWSSTEMAYVDTGVHAQGVDGNGIASITKTSTSGLVDTYTILYDDGDTTTFNVTNGADGEDGEDGTDASVTVTEYQVGSSGTVIPTGTWTTTIPTVTGGQFLWTRFTWNNGTYSYVSTRYGSDGTGGDMYKSVYSPNYTGELASKVDLTNHTSDSAIHVTSGDKSTWNGKASKPDIGTISLTTNWSGSASPYSQVVTVTDATITATSKVDIQPNSTALAQMLTDGCNALYIENNNGTLTAYAIGEHPTTALTLQVCVTEVTL